MLRDIARGNDPQIDAVVQVIASLDADVLLLTGVDYDGGGAALQALQDRLASTNAAYPYRFAFAPNSGVQTGLDLNHDGQIGGPRDAQGYGRFAGAGAMAVLSRLPVAAAQARDFSAFLWADLPDAQLPPDLTTQARAVQRLSSTGHWDVPVLLPDGGSLHLLAFHATPPVFDGAEDRNGRRNHDETAFWLRYLAGELPYPPPDQPVIVLGDANLDAADGDGRDRALQALLHHPALQDPEPRGTVHRSDTDQRGDPALDTARYDPPVGGMRLDYILPDKRLGIIASGVMWPDTTDPLSAILQTASRHRPVWVDLSVPTSAAPL